MKTVVGHDKALRHLDAEKPKSIFSLIICGLFGHNWQGMICRRCGKSWFSHH